MPKIRVPAPQIPQFKEFCKSFASLLQAETGVRLRGNVLLNTMAEAAGHNHYKALLLDAGTYGNGSFRWERLPVQIATRLAVLLELDQMQVQLLLGRALLEVPAARNSVTVAVKETTAANLLNLGVPVHLLPLSGNGESVWKDRYELTLARTGAGRTDHPEFDLLDVISDNPEPVFDLSFSQRLEDPSPIFTVIANMIRQMTPGQQKLTRFVGNQEAFLELLSQHPDLTPLLMNNTSIKAHYNIRPILPSTNTEDIESASASTANAVFANTAPGITLLGEDLMPYAGQELSSVLSQAEGISLGESFAGRKRPHSMMETLRDGDHLQTLIDQVKSDLKLKAGGPYDLMDFSDRLYFVLGNTNGFSSKDLAGWLLDNGRKFETAFIW